MVKGSYGRLSVISYQSMAYLQKMTSIKFSNAKYKGFVDEKYFVDEFLNLLENPDELLSKEGIIFIKVDRPAIIAEVPVFVNGTKIMLIIKRWNRTDIKRMIRDARKPMRTWLATNRFQSLGVPTAYPVAVLERKKFSFFHKSVYISEKILNSVTIFEFSGQRFKDPNIKNRVISDLARLVKRLHKLGVYHNDLGPTNIMVQENNKDINLYLLDLDGIKFKKAISKKERVISLTRVLLTLCRLSNIERSDIKAFFDEYFNDNEEVGLQKRQYMEHIQRRALKIWPHHLAAFNKLLELD